MLKVSKFIYILAVQFKKLLFIATNFNKNKPQVKH